MKAEKHFDRLPKEERQLIALKVAKAIYEYLQLFLSPVIARRIISAILIIAGVHNTGITQLTGLCERSIRDLKNQIAAGDTDSLFETRSGRGRKSKFKDVESQIVEEIERGNYQTLQQIADMVQEKFGINASIMAVSRFLKKRNPQAKGWLNTRQGRCREAAQLL